jgi:hypothetical protein
MSTEAVCPSKFGWNDNGFKLSTERARTVPGETQLYPTLLLLPPSGCVRKGKASIGHSIAATFSHFPFAVHSSIPLKHHAIASFLTK